MSDAQALVVFLSYILHFLHFSTLKRMIAECSGSFKDSMGLVILKKREYLNFFRIKNVLDLNFQTQIYIELRNN